MIHSLSRYKGLIVLLLILPVFISCGGRRTTYRVLPSGRDVMVASWYGDKFHGRPTASGEIFNMYDYTAAHKELPFGTRLRITNPETGRSVEVKVNDRGPYVRGRDIDLSYAAARKIGLIRKGTGRVYVEYLGRDKSYVRPVRFVDERGPFTVQVASFRELSNAFRLKSILEHTYGNVYIMKIWLRGERFYRVRVGRELRRSDAERLAERLSREGYPVLVMRFEEVL